MAGRRLLLSLAHPDDEAFGSGGMIARYVAEGAQVYLICATNGDVGTVAPEKLNGFKSVAELRLTELDCAAERLGLKGVFKLGYKDSGMMGSEASRDPSCLWQQPREVVAHRVVEVLRQVRPQVVVTFNRYGGYGHPDHIAIQRATTDAFFRAGDASCLTPGLEPYAPQKLYYASLSKTMMRLNLVNILLHGQHPRRVGRNRDIDFLKIYENIEPAHAKIDVRALLAAWDDASKCHDSQLGSGAPRLPRWFRRLVAGYQGFTRVYPAPAVNRVVEYDLFVGLIDE